MIAQVTAVEATLCVDDRIYDDLYGAAIGQLETGAVVLATMVTSPTGQVRLKATKVIPVPDDAYLVRKKDRLTIGSEGYMHALAEAEATGMVALWAHTHPGDGSRVSPSRHDLVVNDELRQVFALRSSLATYGWIVLGHQDGRLSFTGALESEGQEQVRITRLNVVGSRFNRLVAQDERGAKDADGLPDLFDRNIRALGTEVQKVISDLTFGLVGAGGTGSAVAEQLVRLGVRRLIIIDPDTLSISNTTRVYGSTPADVDRPKVEVLADHLKRIAPDLQVEIVQGDITAEAVARRLLDADVVFGCTDDNAGRLRLSRLPYYFDIPVIDCGVILTSDSNDIIEGIFGRVTVLHPGTACLMCRDRIDLGRAEAEVREVAEQERLEREGYAAALPGVEPALVPFTTMVAAWAVSELLERLIGYGEDPTPSEILLRVHDRRVGANLQPPTEGHYCDPDKQLEHDEDMFLGMNWTR